MPAEQQPIPARHGTATYVPKGHTIKIINTSGTQVIDTWAFALHQPPSEEEPEKAAKEADGIATQDPGADVQSSEKQQPEAKDEGERKEQESDAKPQTSEEDSATKQGENTENKGEATEEAKSDTKSSWYSYLPFTGSSSKQPTKESSEEKGQEDEATEQKASEETATEDEPSDKKAGVTDEQEEEEKHGEEGDEEKNGEGEDEEKHDEEEDEEKHGEEENEGGHDEGEHGADEEGNIEGKESNQADDGTDEATAESSKDEQSKDKAAQADAPKSTWTSYIPYWGSKGDDQAQRPGQQQSQTSSRTWSSYFPTGVGFTSYLPSSQGALSAFAESHHRDPSKSYAEQLYDFSKTPVGAASLSAATGSGVPGTIYAAYSAYTSGSAESPPMEYMSMPHTRVANRRLNIKVNDVLISNLRQPLFTIIEDTSSGVHDTLMAACDPQRYRNLGVEKWEEHGSCAENLVIALKELNQKTGLTGAKGVGADVTVNAVPAPLNLFMNVPWTQEGDLKIEETHGKEGEYVRLRAERDVVVVMSACPQDVKGINNNTPTDGHFIVEDPEDAQGDKPHESQNTQEATGAQGKSAQQEDRKESAEDPEEGDISEVEKQKEKPEQPSQQEQPKQEQQPSQASRSVEKSPQTPSKAPSTPSKQTTDNHSGDEEHVKNSPKPGRPKPKKLVKKTPASTPSKS